MTHNMWYVLNETEAGYQFSWQLSYQLEVSGTQSDTSVRQRGILLSIIGSIRFD